MNPKKVAKKEIKKKPAATKRVRRTYLYAVGRRKSAIARVRYYKTGEGELVVNKIELGKYFPGKPIQEIVKAPLKTLGMLDKGKFTIKVAGGGKKAQAEAIKLGIARVLVKLDENNKKELKLNKYLTRDPRVKERKKYGLKRARRAPQRSKR